VPLSDHEQRLLEQMEQQLLSDDPRFASTMRGPRRMHAARRRVVLGIVGVVVGLAALVLAVVVVRTIWLGAVAFVIMLAGVVYAMSASSVRSGPVGVVGQDGRIGPVREGRTGSSRRRPAAGRPRTGTFMQRLEQRWERRRDERWG
jgi:hypothetical protein